VVKEEVVIEETKNQREKDLQLRKEKPVIENK
jgi:hypothetical protein